MNDPRPRVLVVDDDASFAGMVSEVLNEKGFDVVQSTDPQEAIGRLTQGTFDAAIVDLVMPQMGGLELAQRIRAASPDTQVLILTGHGDMDSAIEGIQSGIFDYLQKAQIRLPKLERSVRSAVERARLTRQNRELLARLKESNDLLRALHEIGTSIAGEPHLDRLLSRLVASAKELCGAETGRALLVERSHGDELVIESAVGDGADTIRGARLQPGEGIAALAVEKDEAVLVEGPPRAHARYSHRCDEMPTSLPGLLCAPLHHGAVRGVLMVAGRGDPLGVEARELLGRLARQAAVAIENALHHERSINFFIHTSEILVSVLEGMDVFYPGHSRGTAALADMVTRRLGMSDAERRSVHYAALLHDIGKIRVNPAILRSSGQASEDEWRQMREHPRLGLEMLKPITMWEEILPIIHAHHERWDGKGYPRGLAGEDIPLGARIVSVAEVFDVMTRNTPHRPRRTPDEALAELEAFAGTQFDPRVVRMFVAEYRQRGHEIPS